MGVYFMECTVTLRGKCKEMCEKLVRDNPELTMVRGFYWCPIWNKDEPHWWCKDKQGNIVDPTVNQFPSKGVGYYTEFDGFITCEMCGKRIAGKRKVREASLCTNCLAGNMETFTKLNKKDLLKMLRR
jgi:hypothetical protein